MLLKRLEVQAAENPRVPQQPVFQVGICLSLHVLRLSAYICHHELLSAMKKMTVSCLSRSFSPLQTKAPAVLKYASRTELTKCMTRLWQARPARLTQALASSSTDAGECGAQRAQRGAQSLAADFAGGSERQCAEGALPAGLPEADALSARLQLRTAPMSGIRHTELA